MVNKIPLGKPFIGEEEKSAVISLLNSGHIATGETVEMFEKKFAEKVGKKYCIMVNSGTVALYLALIRSSIKEYVIVPSLTCKSVLDAVLAAGLKPIFADVEPDTHNLDLSTLSEDQLNKARGVIVVHSYGHCANIDKIKYYINKYKLVFIEDFAQSVGGYFENKILGSFGDISVTSFYGPKIITTGQGGAILTDDENIYLQCKGMISCKSEKTLYHGTLNFQMMDIAAAIGIEQLKKIDTIIELRRGAANRYYNDLQNLEIGLPCEKEYAKHVYYKFPIILPKRINKIEFIDEMNSHGIQTGILYSKTLHEIYSQTDSKYDNSRLKISENISKSIVSLPMYPELTEDDINFISKTIKKILEN